MTTENNIFWILFLDGSIEKVELQRKKRDNDRYSVRIYVDGKLGPRVLKFHVDFSIFLTIDAAVIERERREVTMAAVEEYVNKNE